MDKRIIIAPGAFDEFDGTQEELDELMAELQNMLESGKLLKNAVSLEELEEDDEIWDLLDKKNLRH